MWNAMEKYHNELYHTGNNYIAIITCGERYVIGRTIAAVKTITPDDKYKHAVLLLATCMIERLLDINEPLHFCGNGFTCTLWHRSGDEKYSEYLFITSRDKPYVSFEEKILAKYGIEATAATIAKLRLAMERRVYNYRARDQEKYSRYITVEMAKPLTEYTINTTYNDLYGTDAALQQLHHLAKKRIADLDDDQLAQLVSYIETSNRPVLLYKGSGDSKLLVNSIVEMHTVDRTDLCNIILESNTTCAYCNTGLTLLNDTYTPSLITFDAIVPVKGHCKDNLCVCCSMCNSKKNSATTYTA